MSRGFYGPRLIVYEKEPGFRTFLITAIRGREH